MLPTSFVHATLIALELPRDLADRYTAPEVRRASLDRDGDDSIPQTRNEPYRAPAWPFTTY